MAEEDRAEKQMQLMAERFGNTGNLCTNMMI